VFQFQLFSTWGDPYYIGLNGLEFYDENGYRIRLTENNITAYPHSVNVLEGVTDDIRTPDKLIDGVNDTNDGRHMWLAPILPGMVRVCFTWAKLCQVNRKDDNFIIIFFYLKINRSYRKCFLYLSENTTKKRKENLLFILIVRM